MNGMFTELKPLQINWSFIASAELSVICMNCIVLDHIDALGKNKTLSVGMKMSIPF